MAGNYFNYFTEIEEYFVRKRGRNLLVSPLDWCLIELWKENGIPLHVVLRGIDRSFESAAKRAKKTPGTLYYCHPAVMEAFEEYQEASLGSHEDDEEASETTEFAGERLQAFLEELRRFVAAIDGDAARRASDRLKALEDEVSRAHSVRLETLDTELAGIRSSLIEELSAGLTEERMGEIRKEARKETRAYKKRLASEMYERLLEKHVESKLAELFALPDFSLLHLE